MPREEFQQSLDDLRASVSEMGDLVLGRLDDGLDALEHGDDDLARAVIHGDDEVNERYLALESECIDLFALQQPVAGDLRFVAASFKILTDLERVGDLATNLGRYALAADDARRVDVDVVDVGRDARDLVADALDAYADSNTDACYDIAERDDDVDALCQAASERVVRDLIEREGGDDPWQTEALMDDVSRLLLTIRDVERVGDHAVNVAARTLYAVESDPELVY
ncbi:phosphate signaling complex protein PhoU [Halobacterium noricense]|uniref:phosphate signaling complex protein PhoU n=1 Tax=Halobacterium noricense TaxID=223182 RepID=UPI001E38C21C|nr:phosphate signaling complex protein PhoU [Halobacterium noricense]UHH24693.1 phosphate signaling complex protein PhoU [Halobacterium noricense]